MNSNAARVTPKWLKFGSFRTWMAFLAPAAILLHLLAAPRASYAPVTRLLFSPDAQWLACDSPDGLTLFDARAGRVEARIGDADSPPLTFRFSPDSLQLASVWIVEPPRTSQIRIHDIPALDEISAWTPLDNRITVLDFSEDGRWVAGGRNNGLTSIWDAETGQVESDLVIERSANDDYDEMAGLRLLDHGRRLAAAGGRNVFGLWDAATGSPISVYSGFYNRLINARIVGAAPVLIGADAGRIYQWDMGSGAPLPAMDTGSPGILALDATSGGHLAAASLSDGGVQIWNARNGEFLRSLRGRAEIFPALAFSPNGRMLATADTRGRIEYWDVETGARLGSVNLTSPAARWIPVGALLLFLAVWNILWIRLHRAAERLAPRSAFQRPSPTWLIASIVFTLAALNGLWLKTSPADMGILATLILAAPATAVILVLWRFDRRTRPWRDASLLATLALLAICAAANIHWWMQVVDLL